MIFFTKTLQTFILFSIAELILSENDATCQHTTVLILARGGSKGIKLKNLQKLNGTSLLGRSLLTIQQSKLFSDVYVSTDNLDIASEAKLCKCFFH